MKKRVALGVFAGLFLLLVNFVLVSGAIPPSYENDVVFKISSHTNAHAQKATYNPDSSIEAKCEGDSLNCVFSQEGECNSQDGCYWDDGGYFGWGECFSSICNTFDEDKYGCKNTEGCEWVTVLFKPSGCRGKISTACEDIDSAETCQGQRGCTWNDPNYQVEIKHSDIFGWPVGDENPYGCSGGNEVLFLSGETNAHANAQHYSGASSICYSNMECRAVDTSQGEDCNVTNDEECIVRLSSEENAHLETCDYSENGYPIKICCSNDVDCEVFTDKDSCRNTVPNACSWTPPGTTTTEEGGGCCPREYAFNFKKGECERTLSTGICTIPVSQAISNEGLYLDDTKQEGPIKYENGKYYYCAQVTSDVNYGYWYNIETF